MYTQVDEYNDNILVKYNNSMAIWVCSDLTLDPALIIGAYAHHV